MSKTHRVVGGHATFWRQHPPNDCPGGARADGHVVDYMTEDGMGRSWLLIIDDPSAPKSGLEHEATGPRGGGWEELKSATAPTGLTLPTVAELSAISVNAGKGATRARLASWGVSWPPPGGWLKQLLEEARVRECEPADGATAKFERKR